MAWQLSGLISREAPKGSHVLDSTKQEYRAVKQERVTNDCTRAALLANEAYLDRLKTMLKKMMNTASNTPSNSTGSSTAINDNGEMVDFPMEGTPDINASATNPATLLPVQVGVHSFVCGCRGLVLASWPVSMLVHFECTGRHDEQGDDEWWW